MANPFQPPQATSPESGSEESQQAAAKPSTHGLWYLLLLPISLLYTLAAREFAGPGYTTAPNQTAMVLFFLAAVAWPVIAIVLVGVIRSIAHIRGVGATSFALLSWIASSVVPFLIGMK
jgi:hypothetical protein